MKSALMYLFESCLCIINAHLEVLHTAKFSHPSKFTANEKKIEKLQKIYDLVKTCRQNLNDL